MKIGTVKTSRLCLRDFESTDITDSYLGWLQDPEVVRYSSQRHIRQTYENCLNYQQSFKDSPNAFVLMITQQGQPVGTMTCYQDTLNQVVDMGILLGERSLWGQGYASEAWGAMLDYWFAAGLRKITAGTLAVNLGMLRIMEKHQMQPDGVRCQHVLFEGQYVDQIHKALFNPVKL